MPQIVDRREVRRLVAARGAQLLEALPAEEYAEEHLVGATNIPLKELTAETARRLDPARPVVAYCWDFL